MAGTSAYSPRDLLQNGSDWTGGGAWRRATSLDMAAKIVLAQAQRQVCGQVRTSLSAGGRTVAELAAELGVGETQLKSKLNGRTRMSFEELQAWRWRLGWTGAWYMPEIEELVGSSATAEKLRRWPLSR